jgi:hypothetical protein
MTRRDFIHGVPVAAAGDARVEQAQQAFRYLQGLGWGKAI